MFYFDEFNGNRVLKSDFIKDAEAFFTLRDGETVATLHEGSKDGRAYTKVIKMVKSPKTGAYIFNEQMVPNEEVKDFFKN